MASAIADATSPYLLQHAANPVDWRPWGAEALEKARREDKPILLSIGYAACHWCHVMARESFENDAIAEQMNRDFVSIKVDREERPDLDDYYQRALARLGQHGGWPLTMVLDVDGAPLWGGTYFPPERRWGRPGFGEVLAKIAELWSEDRASLRRGREALQSALTSPPADPSASPSADEERDWARAVAGHLDAIHGGIGGAPKFPQAPLTDWLWGAATRFGDVLAERRLRHGAIQMCEGGIWDHLGGGLARYATDVAWLVPHFEKMLYDNAQFLRFLAELHRAEPEPLFAARAAELVVWLEREMLCDGAFASSFDADSEGEEGVFYVWTAEEIEDALGAEAERFMLAYGVTRAGNWEGRTILNRLAEPGWRGDREEAALARARAALFERRRASRVPPARDDKILSEWNGLMVAALADAAFAFERPDWLALAETVFDRTLDRAGEGEGVGRGWRGDKRIAAAFAEDGLAMARAAWALFEATGAPARLAQARQLTRATIARFGEDGGGVSQTARDAADAPPRHAPIVDGPTPSANAHLLWIAAALAHGAGDAEAMACAQAVAERFAAAARAQPAAHGGYLRALALWRAPAVAFVVGRDQEKTKKIREILMRHRRPDQLVVTIGEEEAAALPEDHPAHGKTALGGAAAHLCADFSCAPPIESPDALIETLRRSRAER